MGFTSVLSLILALALVVRDARGVCNAEIDEKRLVCPLDCQCSATEVTCEDAGLSAMPNPLPTNLEYFKFTGNSIKQIQRDDFMGCGHLRHLYLEYNEIRGIHPEALSDLTHLRNLSLAHNKLNYDSSHLALISLSLTECEYLDLQYNNMPYDPMHLNTYLPGLRKLRSLRLDANVKISNLKPILSLQHLKTFHVYNHMKKVYNEAFEAFSFPTAPLITEFGIHSITLTNLDVLSFSHFKYLETLDLSFNPRLGFKNMSVAWHGLPRSSIKELRLEASSPYETQTINLKNDFFNHLNQTNLTKLILDGNSIIFVKAKFHRHLPNLEYLSLAYNRIQNHAIDIGFDVLKLERLVYIDVSHQSRRKLYEWLERLPSYYAPNSLNNSYSGAVVTPKLIYGTKNEQESDNDDISTEYTQPGVSTGKKRSYSFWTPPNLRELILVAGTNLNINYIPSIFFFLNSDLRLFDYSNNHVVRFCGHLTFSLNQTHRYPFSLLFRNNQARYISPSFFRLGNGTKRCNYTIEFGTLDFSGNRFAIQVESDVVGNLWKQLTQFKVKQFHLADNGIQLLHQPSLNGLESAQLLNLSSNALRRMSASLSHMPNLSSLDLSYNLLEGLESGNMQELDDIAEHANISVNLTGNPLQCNCQTLAFLRWMLSTKVMLVDWQTYMCSYDGKIIQLWQLRDDIIPALNVVCSSNNLLVAGGSCVATLIVITAVASIVYRHRWDIRYASMKLTRGRKRLQEEHTSYEYDAFVVFHSSSWTWVRYKLMPRLEEDGPYPRLKLCVHHRDWMPGTPIEENIQHSIESSRKTILVMTKEFATSGWCGFEAHMARVRSFDERLDVIVPIMLEDIPVELMGSTLKGIVRENTYIEWPSIADYNPEHIHAQEFWNQLRRAIRFPGDRPLMCDCGRRCYYHDDTDGNHSKRTFNNDATSERNLDIIHDNHLQEGHVDIATNGDLQSVKEIFA